MVAQAKPFACPQHSSAGGPAVLGAGGGAALLVANGSPGDCEGTAGACGKPDDQWFEKGLDTYTVREIVCGTYDVAHGGAK